MSDARRDVTVIVPTRNRARTLADLLDSFDRQTLSPDRFEVIIADNGSTDGTDEMVRNHATRAAFRLVYLPMGKNSGPVLARNTAAQQSESPFLAFTDSDCRVAPNWLETGLASFDRTPVPTFVSGPVFNKPEQRIRALSLVQPATDGEDPTFRACNIFYRRSIFLEVGGFDMDAYIGDSHFMHFEYADIDLAWRLKHALHPTHYEPALVVYHEVWTPPPWSWLMKHTQQGPLPLFLKRHPEAASRFLWFACFVSPASALWWVSVIGAVLAIFNSLLWLLAAAALPVYYLASPIGPMLFRSPIRAGAMIGIQLAGQSVACLAVLIGSIKARRLVL